MGMLKKTGGKLGVFGELLAFFWHQKLWWMIPMIVILVIFGLFLIFAQSSPIASFIYTLF